MIRFTKEYDDSAKVLIVDDEQTNREILEDILTESGHEVQSASNGSEALEITKAYAPDLILLDIMMPDMTGYEVCEQLKKDPETLSIPIIFITALDGREDITKGLKLGATDFLSKPIHAKDVLLRSRNAIFMKKLIDEQKEHVQQLEELHKLNDELNHMIVHDMRNPLSGMVGYIDILKSQIMSSGNEMQQKMIGVIDEQANRLIEMVSSLLDINKFEKGEMKLQKSETDFIEVVDAAMRLFAANNKQIRIELKTDFQQLPLTIDKGKIERVLENLITNAIKYSDENDRLIIDVGKEDNRIMVKVIDNGPGIPEKFWKQIFEKFGQVESRSGGEKYSTGLGLTFCKYAVEAHDGEIGVYNNPDGGSTFWFKF
ncbi:MAG: response regulator [Fidelibacterota bacterium]